MSNFRDLKLFVKSKLIAYLAPEVRWMISSGDLMMRASFPATLVRALIDLRSRMSLFFEVDLSHFFWGHGLASALPWGPSSAAFPCDASSSSRSAVLMRTKDAGDTVHIILELPF